MGADYLTFQVLDPQVVLVLQLLHLRFRLFLVRLLVVRLRHGGFLQRIFVVADEEELGVLVVQQFGLERHPAAPAELVQYPGGHTKGV